MFINMEVQQQQSAPLVSFIVACYNLPEHLLCTCIDSILSLSLQPGDREIIVVDDGSDTSPLNALLKYGDAITYLRKSHEGLSAARNLGIELSKGLYLQFVDGDDQLIPSGYEVCLDILRAHPNGDMILFDFDESTFSSSTAPHMPRPTSGTSYMRHHNIHGSACGYLVRRTTLSELRFAPGIYHEDELFTPLLMIRAEVVYPTKVKAYCYQKRPNSITTNADAPHVEKRHLDFLHIIRELNLIADRLPKNDQLAMERRVAQLTMDYLYNIIVQTRSLSITLQHIQVLRAEGLFPLPNRSYTSKYLWFRHMTSTRLGLALLVKALPIMKRER